MTKVLVIDDESGIRHALSKLLKNEGFEVYTAEDGKVGLEIVEKEPVDLVFLDIQLPDMDGLKVLELIKKKKPKLPVIMCSGFNETDFAVQAIKMGAADFVGKPFKNEETIKTARKALGNAQAASEGGKAGVEKAKAVETAKIQKKTYLMFFAGGGVLLLAIVVLLFLYLSGTFGADKVYQITYTHPSGLCRQGDVLWACDWYSQSVYKHRTDSSLTLIKAYSFPDIHFSGITLISGVIYTCDSWTGRVFRHKMDENLTVEKTFTLAQTNPSGIFWDGTDLWTCDAVTKKIYRRKLDEKLSVVAEYEGAADGPVSVFKDGKSFWNGDRTESVINVHTLNKTLSFAGFLQTDEMKLNKGKLSAFTADKNSFWYAFDEVGSIYRTDKNELKKNLQKKPK